jgi:hypothetical protein
MSVSARDCVNKINSFERQDPVSGSGGCLVNGTRVHLLCVHYCRWCSRLPWIIISWDILNKKFNYLCKKTLSQLKADVIRENFLWVQVEYIISGKLGHVFIIFIISLLFEVFEVDMVHNFGRKPVCNATCSFLRERGAGCIGCITSSICTLIKSKNTKIITQFLNRI